MATWFGAAPPEPARARVLELGSASGGNIIPLALRYPEARFVGIDIAARHITDGRARIAACGIDNIVLHRGDLAAALPIEGAFDYIICHGVFSWVPPPVQEAILRICAERLSPHGIATVSFNVLPGWHMRRVVRDLCLAHAGDGPPRARVNRARAALANLAPVAPREGPYGQVLREEAARIARMPASYILGEFLAPYNEPCTITDFIARAAAHGLHYLCDSDVPADSLPPPDGAARAEAEQRQDFITGRTFRRAVLLRDAPARDAVPAVNRAARPALPAPRTGRATDPHPTAWPMARVEAAAGLPWFTSLRHEAIPSTAALRALAIMLDGTISRADLFRRFEGAAAAPQHLEAMLAHFERHALLQP